MRKPAADLLALLLVSVARPAAADHLVSSADVRRALLAPALQRERDFVTLERHLGIGRQGPAGVKGLARAIPVLSDGELRDLAACAEALESDPSATGAGTAILIVVLVALVVFSILFVDWAKSFE